MAATILAVAGLVFAYIASWAIYEDEMARNFLGEMLNVSKTNCRGVNDEDNKQSGSA